MQHDLVASECAADAALRVVPMGAGMAGPLIIAFGTPTQQRRWMRSGCTWIAGSGRG